MDHIKIRHIMSQHVITLHKEQSLMLADELMRMRHIRHIPVVDDDEALVGLVTHRDLLAAELSSTNSLSLEDRAELQMSVQVSRVMSSDVWSVHPDTPAVDVAQLLIDQHFGCAPVVDDGGRLVGIVTEADFLSLAIDALAQEGSAITVSELMSTDLVTLRRGQTLFAADDLMALRQVRHLPVVEEDGHLAGLVTHRDLLAARFSALSSKAPRYPGTARIVDIMREDVWTINVDAPALSAAQNLSDHIFGCLPVVESGSLVGIVSESDFLSFLIERYGPRQRSSPRLDVPVTFYMHSPVHEIAPSASIERAQELLATHGVSSLAVVDSGELCGVITRTDLLRVSLPRLMMRRRRMPLRLPSRSVADVMTCEVTSVAPDTSVSVAAQRMLDKGIHRLFVTVQGDAVGVFSATDAMEVVRDLQITTTLAKTKSQALFSIGAEETISAGVKLLEKADVESLVVLSAGWPVGIFGSREVLSSRHLPRDAALDKAMSHAFIALPAHTPMYRAAEQAVSLRVMHVVVFEDNNPRALLTPIDFVRACAADSMPDDSPEDSID